MANDQPAGPVEHLIPVQCDLENSTIELTLPVIGIKPGDWVIWQFFGLPEGWSPWIELPSSASFLGPFNTLTQSGTSVWGDISGDQTLGEPFVYCAMIQKGQGAPGAVMIRSNAGSLVPTPPGAGTAQRFTVLRQGDELQVSPLGVVIDAADTVEWDFAALDEAVTPDMAAWRPVVVFHRYAGQGEVPDLYLGPFTSLTTAARGVRGMGNNHVEGTYYFQVAAVQVSDGKVIWISSPDPAIDNRGGVLDPPPGG